jgi:hypothetical protein
MTYTVKKDMKLIDFHKPIVCSVESYVPESETKVEVLDEKKKIIRPRLAYLGRISRNRCLYGIDAVMKSMEESRYVQENLAQGTWLGEKEHPDKNCDLSRFMRIMDEKVCHQIKKYWLENDFLTGIVQFIPPWGDIVWRWITEANCNIGFSLRIYTPNFIKKKDSGGEYVEKVYPMYPVTFDAVNIPGYRECRTMDPDVFAKGNGNIKASGILVSAESYDNIIPDPAKEIKKILLEYGEESNVIQDIYNFDMSEAKMILNSEDNIVRFSTENGLELSMHVNPFIVAEVLGKKRK